MKRFTALLPLALAISLPASGQTLQEAMRSALEYHPEVQSALNARLSVDERLKAAKGGYLPKVDLLMGYGWEGSDNPTTRGDGDHRKTLTRGESSLSLQQMLFDGFATDSEVARQRATVNSRALELMGISQRTALKTAEVYLDVLRRQEFVRLAEYNLRSHERVYEQITQRSARGVGRMADQEQAEARLAQARNNLITEQTNLADAKVNYFSVVGRPAENLSPPDGLAGLVPEDLLAARQEMLQNNPFLRSSEADVDAADAQYQAARSTYYPRFDVELANGYNDDLDGTKGHDNSWQAMVRMRYNRVPRRQRQGRHPVQGPPDRRGQGHPQQHPAGAERGNRPSLELHAQRPAAVPDLRAICRACPPRARRLPAAVHHRRADPARPAGQRERTLHLLAPARGHPLHLDVQPVPGQGGDGLADPEPERGRAHGRRADGRRAGSGGLAEH